MKTLAWDEKSYILSGERKFLVSGEFHYFRVPTADWATRLRLFKQAGGNCVATYIPWILHEPTEGQFLFGDIPERDLVGFLDLCKHMDLFVIARPGPYVYSELLYGGLPKWLIETYPEILAKDVHGNVFGGTAVSYLHPEFLQKAERWYKHVCGLLAPYTEPGDGTIPFVQLDNELMGVHEWNGSWDYNREAMGIGVNGGRYPNFLRVRYETIGHLNRCYLTDYTSFEDVMPVSQHNPSTLAEQRTVRDYQEFYFEAAVEYLSILQGWAKQAGIRCDMMHNAANPGMIPYFTEAVRKFEYGFLLGFDNYYNLSQDWNQNNPTPQYAVKTLVSNEILRAMGFPATVLELPGGSCSDWPPILPEDLRCCYYANLAYGMKGFNYYIFTGGHTPFKLCEYGDCYDFNASVSAQGSLRPTYEVQKEFGSFLLENAWLAEAERQVDFYVGFNWEYGLSRYYSSSPVDGLFSNMQAWELMQKGLVTTAHCASLAPGFLDLHKDELSGCGTKPLVVAAAASMAAAVQQKLVDYVKSGGKILMLPVIPTMDENFNPCTILLDYLSGAPVSRLDTPASRFTMGDIRNIYVNGGIWTAGKLPCGTGSIAVEEFSGLTAGWEMENPAGGKIIWLGLNWRHAKQEHSDLLVKLLSKLGLGKTTVLCDNPNVWTAVRSNGKRRMLFVMNLFSSPLETNIKVQSGEEEVIVDCLRLRPMEVICREV